MANEMQTRMMLREAAKHDQILKNSLPISIPLPGHHSSCTLPAGRAVRLDPESRTSPDGGKRSSLAECKLLSSPPEMTKTAITHHLRNAETKRMWPQGTTQDVPDTALPHVAEAIMVFERGDEHDERGACNRCRRGEGTSKECVTISDVPWACSNCIYDRCSEACELSCRRPSVAKEDERGEGGEDEEVGDDEGNVDFWGKTDEIADRHFVLSLVKQLRQRAGYGEEESPVERARQIERAALRVSQLARVFSEEMQRSDGSLVVPSVVNRMLS